MVARCTKLYNASDNVTSLSKYPWWLSLTVSHLVFPRSFDNRCRGLMQKVKIWAFWTRRIHKISLKFIQMKSGQHPKPKFLSRLCIRLPKLEKLSRPAHQASKRPQESG